MNCPYCNNEMENGQIMAYSTGDMPVAFLSWFAEKEFENKGIIASLKRKSIAIKDTKDGYYKDSYHCRQRKIAIAEFPTK